MGKTAVKEMTALTLSVLGPVLKSEKNENNEIGVAQTLLRLNETHRAAVIEKGMRGKGQIANLAACAHPTIGTVTVIGESHLELLGSREAIADAKGELLEALPSAGAAVLNLDDPFFNYLRVKTSAAIVGFGLKHLHGVHASNVQPTDQGWQATVALPTGERAVMLVPSVAKHDVLNALAAIAASTFASVELTQAVERISGYQPQAMRMELIRSASGAQIISDCYNAAPTSMLSALHTLTTLGPAIRLIAFLGDMKELGAESEEMHGMVAKELKSAGVDLVFAVGPLMAAALPQASRSFETSEEAARFVSEQLKLDAGDVVLVKGSRAMGMEIIVDTLRQL